MICRKHNISCDCGLKMVLNAIISVAHFARGSCSALGRSVAFHPGRFLPAKMEPFGPLWVPKSPQSGE